MVAFAITFLCCSNRPLEISHETYLLTLDCEKIFQYEVQATICFAVPINYAWRYHFSENIYVTVKERLIL